MRIVELDRDFVGQRLPTVSETAEARQAVRQRTGDEEVLWRKAQQAAALGGVVGIQYAAEVLRHDLIVHRADEVAAAELAEVERLGRGAAPQAQRVDRVSAVA